MLHEKEVRKAVDDAQQFILNNTFAKSGLYKRWFININYERSFIKLHPEGGKIDIQHNVSTRYADHYQSELRDLRTGKTFWFGLFNNFLEAAGYALIISKMYKRQTEYKLKVTGCIDDIVCMPIDPF